MDRLQAMQVFTRVVDTSSFTKAAETLSLPRASVTTIIQNLEAFLGVRLMHRTTRRLSLTPDGAAYVTGVDFAVLAPDGRLREVTGFFAPPAPAA